MKYFIYIFDYFRGREDRCHISKELGHTTQCQIVCTSLHHRNEQQRHMRTEQYDQGEKISPPIADES